MNDPNYHLMPAGDCRLLLPALREKLVDAIVTDPPYHLTNAGGGSRSAANAYSRARAGAERGGFMGKKWDGGDVAFRPETWAAHLRVAKPGAFLVAFGGTRTAHRLAVAIENGGWKIRDTLMWIYGSGFPKSKNMGDGRGTALKPAWEPIILAQRRTEGTVAKNLAMYGTGVLNIDACRVDVDEGLGRWPANLVHDGSDNVLACFPDAVGQLADASTSTSTRKTQHVYKTMKRGNSREGEPSADSDNAGVVGFAMKPGARRADSGSAARFYYCAKASTRERGEGNDHPTVKPLALMRWLVDLVAPPGGIVLDPFTGSGSTGVACLSSGRRFIGMDLEQHNLDIARARILASLGSE